MAALTAPPSVFAETVPAPVPAPTVPEAPPVPAPPAGAIRIGLGWELTVADVAAPGGLYVIGGGAVVATIPAGQAAKLTLDAGQVAVAGVTQKFTSVRLVPVPPPAAPAPTQPAPTQPAPTQPAPTQPAPTQPAPTQPAPETPPPAPSNPIIYKTKPYRGEIEVVVGPVSKKLSVVNVVNID